MKNKTFQAITALVGTTIGAGIFGLPFVVAKIGFALGVVYLLALGLLTLLLNLCYGEVILRTPGDHQLTGYSKIYLGKWGRAIAFLALLLTVYGALLAYFIKIGEFLSFVFGFGFPVYWSFFFLVLAGLALFFGLRTVGPLEGLLVVVLLGLIVFLSFLGFPKLELANFSGLDLNFLFLPYGVMLFALSGSSVVPEMEEILRQEHGNLKKAIILGTTVPLAFYFLFVTLVVGICGRLTSDDAVLGLAFFLPTWIVDLGAVLGTLTMGTSFLTLGYVLREVYFRDFGIPKILSWVLVCLGPPVFYFLGAQNFIGIIGATGALMGGLTGILIVLMFLKSKKMGERGPTYVLPLPKFLPLLLVFVFILGIVWQIWEVLR
jgi:tyrosine-specific transport protein